jgi:polysaccharide biosynthesis transport protein
MENTPESRIHFLDYWRIVRSRLGLVILVFILVVSTDGVVTYFTPKEYSSFATIELEPDMTPVRIFDDHPEPVDNARLDQRFVPTQFQIISRKGVLYPVIDRLDLQKKWAEKGEPLAKEISYNKLRGMLSLEEVRNTNLIQITVYSVDPGEAALLANTIARVYMDQRISERQALLAKGLQQLNDDVKKKEQDVNDAYAEASKLRTEFGIVDPNPDSLDNSMRVEDSSVLANQSKVDDTKSQVATLRSRVEQLDQLKRGDLMRAAGLLNLGDPIIEEKLPVYQTAVAEKARMLNSGLGRNHPDVKAIQAQIDVLQQQLNEQIDSLRKGLAAQLKIAEDSLQAMQGNLRATQDQQQQKKTASVAYINAKYKYVQERNLLEAAKARLNTETMQRTMPQESAAIRDSAEPGMIPVRPKRLMNLLVGAVAGLMLGVGLALFIEYLDTSVKTMDDVEKFLNLPVLAVVPKGIRMLTGASEDSPDAEAYRLLSSNVEFRWEKGGAGARTISIVSGTAGEGKSTTTCNLGITIAAAGQRILIVDADMRRPAQHELLGCEGRLGLGDYLSGEAELQAAIHPTSIANLYILPGLSKSSRVIGLLKSKRMGDLIDTVKREFDVVLFDCTPIFGVSDASVVTNMVDACLLVVQHRRLPRTMLLRVKSTIDSLKATVLGVVLNNVDVRHDNQYQFYTSYRDYAGKEANSPRTKPKPVVKIRQSSNGKENSPKRSSTGDDEY